MIESEVMRLQSVQVPSEVSDLEFRPGSPPVWIGDSRLVLADKDAGQVVILDLESGASSRIGRRGMGPGEMLLPMWTVVRPDGAMVIGDGLGMTVTEFTAAGKAARIAHFPGRPLAVTAWTGDTVTGVWIDGGQPVVGAIDLNTDEAVDRFRPFASPRVAASAHTPNGPTMFVSAASGGGDRTLVSGGQKYDVFSFDPSGNLDRVFSRPDVAPELMSEQEFARFSENLTRALRIGGREMLEHRDEALEQARRRPKPFFKMGALSVDALGRLWVVTSHFTPTGTAVDVFSADGAFLTRLDIPGRIGSLSPNLPYVAVLREGVGGDQDGVEGVDVYRIVD